MAVFVLEVAETVAEIDTSVFGVGIDMSAVVGLDMFGVARVSGLVVEGAGLVWQHL